MKKFLWFVLILVIILVIILTRNSDKPAGDYNPIINAADFSLDINNPYFSLVPGTKITYEGRKDYGIEKTEVTVLNETKDVMGVQTRVVKDQVFLNGSLIEDTKDWYAQDKEGNVWYFGEETVEYEDGKIVSRAGSWEAGVKGAKPGIIMKANPKVDDTYREEYLQGEAEDEARIVSISEDVTIPYGSYTGCIKTYNYTALDPEAKEYKYYCEGVWHLLTEKDGQRTELTSITTVK